MSALAFQIVEANSSNELSNVISDYVAGEQFQSDKWNKTVRIAYDNHHDEDSWKDYCTSAEDDQASRREAQGEVIKRTKSGKVVASAAFPKTWNTDKAIIGKALHEGVSLVDADGEPKAKSALQNEYREAAADAKVEKPAYEKITTVINAYQTLYRQLEDDSERRTIKDIMDAFHASV